MKITRRKLRKLLLKEIRLLNEAGMEELAYDIEIAILNLLERSYSNSRNIDDVVAEIYFQFQNIFPDIAAFKEAVIDSLSFSFELEYDDYSGVVRVKPEFIDMSGY